VGHSSPNILNKGFAKARHNHILKKTEIERDGSDNASRDSARQNEGVVHASHCPAGRIFWQREYWKN
jgi:hypothetical protein